MAGSWEIIKQNRVLTCILTREMVTTKWASNFRNLQIPGTFAFFSGMPFDHARNTACNRLLDLDWEWLFFLDDDMILPHDAIFKLMNHKLPIVSGLYYRRNLPLYPVMLKEQEDGVPKWITEYRQNELVEVDMVGSGCMLIHRDLLLATPPISEKCRWFEWRCDRPDLDPKERVSEDFAFCKHIKKTLGVKIYVDTSVKCLHVGLSESGENIYQPAVI